jgi:hypothetical protein
METHKRATDQPIHGLILLQALVEAADRREEDDTAASSISSPPEPQSDDGLLDVIEERHPCR